MTTRLLCLLLVLPGCEAELVGRTPAPPSEADADMTATPVDCSTAPLPGRRVRRLTRRELANAENEVVQASILSADSLSPDEVVDGFETASDTLTVEVLLADQLQVAAERAGAALSMNPRRFGGCDAPTDACRDAMVRALGKTVFRRSLTDVEVADYRTIYELVRAEGHAAGVALVAEAMLSSPFFIYRTELGVAGPDGAFHLTDEELAQQLAFFLTGHAPDERLRHAVAAGELATPAQVRAQAERLLGTGTGLSDFVDAWLELDRLDSIPKDDPTFSTTIRQAMRSEARLFVGEVVRSNGTLRDLYAGRFSVVNRALAEFYQLPAPSGSGFERVAWPQGRRGGLLTLGAFLATHGKPSESSPIHRGTVVRKRLLCQPLPPPPPNVNAAPPPPSMASTTRERFVAHSQDAQCAGCHQLIDPPGFALEHFDGVGRERTTENGKPIDATGTLTGLATPVTLSDARSLAEAIADSPEGRQCFATQVVRFGLGSSGVQDPWRCVANTAGAVLDGPQPLREVYLTLVTSSAFRRRAGEGAGMPPSMTPPPTMQPPAMMPPPTMMPPNAGPISVARTRQSEWPTGFCDEVKVQNTSTSPVAWSVELDVMGSIQNAWNAAASAAGARTRFVGVTWNATLAPGAEAAFGFCAAK
jgi:hypothetical protein